jgi:hypothetical protein
MMGGGWRLFASRRSAAGRVPVRGRQDQAGQRVRRKDSRSALLDPCVRVRNTSYIIASTASSANRTHGCGRHFRAFFALPWVLRDLLSAAVVACLAFFFCLRGLVAPSTRADVFFAFLCLRGCVPAACGSSAVSGASP